MKYSYTILVVAFCSLFASCSKSTTDFLINDWKITEIEFLKNKDKRVGEIADVLKYEGYIIFDKDRKYIFHTPNKDYVGTWYFTKGNNDTFYTINELGDTIPNKIEVLSKDKVVFQTNDPETPMKFKLAPRK